MSNAAANLKTQPSGEGGRKLVLPVDGGTHLYEGTLVSQLTSTGMLVPTSTASSGPAIGVVTMECDNSSGSDSSLYATVQTDRVFYFKNGSSSDAFSEASLIGSRAYALDDHTVADNDNSGTLAVAGIFVGYESGTNLVRVLVTSAALATTPVATTVAALTDNSGGSANSTIQVLPTLTDSPATADALRDDFNTNVAPALANNFADLAAKINAVIAALKAAGLMAN